MLNLQTNLRIPLIKEWLPLNNLIYLNIFGTGVTTLPYLKVFVLENEVTYGLDGNTDLQNTNYLFSPISLVIHNVTRY